MSERDWGLPALSKDKRYKRTDDARKVADETDEFLRDLDNLLLDSPKESK